MIQEIAQLIENETAWDVGATLFVGHLPQKTSAGAPVPDRMVLILEAGGDQIFQLRDRVDLLLTIITRAKSYFTARADAVALRNLLHGRARVSLPVLTSGEEYEAASIEAVAYPVPTASPDERGNHSFIANYLFRIKDATL